MFFGLVLVFQEIHKDRNENEAKFYNESGRTIQIHSNQNSVKFVQNSKLNRLFTEIKTLFTINDKNQSNHVQQFFILICVKKANNNTSEFRYLIIF